MNSKTENLVKKRSRSLNVLIADDHEMIRAGLRNFFVHYFKGAEVNEAATYEEVVSFSAKISEDWKLDVILIDLHMPGGAVTSWCDSLRAVCDAFPGTPVVIISGMEDPVTIGTALKCGARGFLPKTMRGQSMHAALGLVLAGEIYVPPHLAKEIPDTLSQVPTVNPPQSVNEQGSSNQQLSARELSVVQLLVRGLSNKEIARELSVQEITVKVHLRSIFRKLGATNRVTVVRIALGNRIVVPDESVPAMCAS